MASAYLLTFGTYGTHLHGDVRGSVRMKRGYQPPDESLWRVSRAAMKESAFVLHAGAPDLVLKAMIAGALHRSWFLDVAHVRTEHVHVVISFPPGLKPKKVIADLKAYGTHALREAGIVRDRYWARGGHAWPLMDEEAVARARIYVFEKQGEPMARYPFVDSP